MSSYSKILSLSRLRTNLISLPGAKRPHRLPPGGGSAVRRWRRARALHFRTTAPSAHNLPLQGDNALFSVTHSLPRAMSKKKVPKKKCANLRFDRPDARATVQENSDRTSRTSHRCKWGAAEGLKTTPIIDFSPRSAYSKAGSSSRALRPARRMGTDGACAWEHFSRLCPLSVTFRDTCLAAARSRSGSDSRSGCHSTPSRRCATREWEAWWLCALTGLRRKRKFRIQSLYSAGKNPPKGLPKSL